MQAFGGDSARKDRLEKLSEDEKSIIKINVK
jgi:hypothetical protein